ncbi:hypothetical protein CP533_1888 [Ophiocordyceps camponoti-saundersi (nom. inval.)]|nr:hypothetical protein CP533_1888 [Ophiocordyceps camponoti-saundersi (nom. inval.)]
MPARCVCAATTTTAISRENDYRDTAMDALDFLVSNIPDWLRQLDDLSGQIDRRQAELAAFNAQQPPGSRAVSLRNKGSAESLKPKDDGPLHMDVEIAQQSQEFETIPPEHEGANLLALQKKAREAVAAAHPRARPLTKNRRMPSSAISAEGAPSTYPMRSMVIVYYDSYVQGFFDSLVRFVSSSRNHLRKARMTAKVAHIKRMAEREMRDSDQTDGEEKTAPGSLPSLRYIATTRRSGAISAARRTESDNQPPDIFETLDKSLELVQSTCEHGAHQFLREANCEAEIRKIQARMSEVIAAAEKEIERSRHQDPDETGDGARPSRTRRPISVRKDMATGLKSEMESEKEAHVASETLEQTVESLVEAVNPLEVDTSEDPDEGVDVMLPKLQYRSTRYMRTRAS